MPGRTIPHPAKAIIVARGEKIGTVAERIGTNAHTLGRVLNRKASSWPALRQRLAEDLGLAEEELFFPDGAVPSSAAVDRLVASTTERSVA